MKLVYVNLTEEYEAWKYNGGTLDEINQDVRRWLEGYHLRHVSLSQDSNTMKQLEELRNRFPKELRDAWMYLRTDPVEHLVWSVDGTEIACFPGMYIVQTDLGPCAFSALEVEEV